MLPVSVHHTVINALKNIISGKPIRLRQYLDFKVSEHKMCVLIFSTTFVSNISHFKK